MMSYINETDFVIENKELVYPEIVTDGLQLYYDAKGKRNTDYHRDKMLDMSGNKNHGELHNFAYEKHSGYKDGLVFDYVDDKLVRPALNLQPNDFAFMLNSNIISFSPDGTVKRVQDGEVIKSEGFNVVRNGDFIDGANRWLFTPGVSYYTSQNELIVTLLSSTNREVYMLMPFEENHLYYISLEMKSNSASDGIRFMGMVPNPLDSHSGSGEYERLSILIDAHGTPGYSSELRILDSNREGDISDNPTYITNVIEIDLTETFGAGNEPTKKEMDEIIQLFGFIPNTQDLIDRIEYKGNDLGDMENIIDGLYKTDILSGEEIYTEKADDAMVHVGADGKSVGGGSGKNLVPLFDDSRWSIDTNYFTIESPRRLNLLPLVISVGEIEVEVKPYTDYTYTFNSDEGRSSVMGSSRDSILPLMNRSFVRTFNTGENTSIILHIGRYSRNENTAHYWDLQLEEGSVGTEYEPPAPSPDHPIEIHSLNDFDVVSSVGRENLLLSDNFHKTNYNNYQWDFVNLDDNVNPSLHYNSFIHHYYEPGQYTLSFEMKYTKNYTSSSANIRLSRKTLSDSSFTSIAYVGSDFNDKWKKESYTFSLDKASLIGLQLYSRTNTDISIRNLKLERGRIATEWTPSSLDILELDSNPLIDKINLSLNEPLRSVGDVEDRLFRDSDGVWKVERNVGEQVFENGDLWASHTWYQRESSAVYGLYIHNSSSMKENGKVIISHVPENRRTNGLDGNMGALHTNPRLRIRIENDILGINEPSPSAFKKWLVDQYNKGTPLTIIYESSEPTFEILPIDIQDKLNTLRSFEDSNYVYTVLPNENNYPSKNLKPTLHAKFLYNDWYKKDRVINNLMIYNRALTNEEMLQNYKTIKRRWGM